MKAIDLLRWVVDNGIDGRTLKFLEVPDERLQTETWWWDNVEGLPPSPVKSGLYLYLDTTDERISHADMCGMEYAEQVELGYAHYINLYLIDDGL